MQGCSYISRDDSRNQRPNLSDKNSNQLARIHTTTTVHHKAAKSLRVHVQTKKPYSVCLEPTCFEAARGISSEPTHRYFGATWSFKCPVGCQPAGTLEPLGVSNALRAAKPRVLWSHWGFKCPAGCQPAGTLFGATWSFECPAGCQAASTLEPLGA